MGENAFAYQEIPVRGVQARAVQARGGRAEASERCHGGSVQCAGVPVHYLAALAAGTEDRTRPHRPQHKTACAASVFAPLAHAVVEPDRGPRTALLHWNHFPPPHTHKKEALGSHLPLLSPRVCTVERGEIQLSRMEP